MTKIPPKEPTPLAEFARINQAINRSVAFQRSLRILKESEKRKAEAKQEKEK